MEHNARDLALMPSSERKETGEEDVAGKEYKKEKEKAMEIEGRLKEEGGR